MPVWLEAANKGDEVARAKYEKALARQQAKGTVAKTQQSVANTEKSTKQGQPLGVPANTAKTGEKGGNKAVTPAIAAKTTEYQAARGKRAKRAKTAQTDRAKSGNNARTAQVLPKTQKTVDMSGSAGDKEGVGGDTPVLAAVRRYCFEVCCSGSSRPSVYGNKIIMTPNCVRSDCPLYAYRLGKYKPK